MAKKPKKISDPSVKKGLIQKGSSGPETTGVDMSDLVGTIQITVDPLVFQRNIRDEWERSLPHGFDL
jgi:hypothetical protein